MILVSNCPHGNATYTLIDEAAQLVIKSSYDPAGIERLAREHAGYEWFLARTAASARLQYARPAGRAYARLTVERFPGRPGNPYAGLRANYQDALRTVETYAGVWPHDVGGLSALHGDLSLGNVIFSPERVAFVDWEHFHPAAVPWGFDLVTLIYECAFFSCRPGRPMAAADRELFVRLRRRVRELVGARGGFDCRLDALTAFIRSHAHFWGPLIKKLPVMQFADAQRRQLLELERPA